MAKQIAVAALGGALFGALGTTFLYAQTQRAPPAYVIAEFTVKDPNGFRQSGQGLPASLTPYGGHFLARFGKVEGLHGAEPKGPLAVIAFGSFEDARRWANSPEYAAIVPLRDKAADSRIFILEGLPVQ